MAAPDHGPTLVAAAALVDVRGCVLVQQRPPGKPWAGLWEFPGGKVEAGETPGAALRRELREELAIDIAERDAAPLSFASEAGEGTHLLLLLYLVRHWTGTPRPYAATALRWVPAAALGRLAMPPADVPLATTLDRLLRPSTLA